MQNSYPIMKNEYQQENVHSYPRVHQYAPYSHSQIIQNQPWQPQTHPYIQQQNQIKQKIPQNYPAIKSNGENIN